MLELKVLILDKNYLVKIDWIINRFYCLDCLFVIIVEKKFNVKMLIGRYFWIESCCINFFIIVYMYIYLVIVS